VSRLHGRAPRQARRQRYGGRNAAGQSSRLQDFERVLGAPNGSRKTGRSISAAGQQALEKFFGTRVTLVSSTLTPTADGFELLLLILREPANHVCDPAAPERRSTADRADARPPDRSTARAETGPASAHRRRAAGTGAAQTIRSRRSHSLVRAARDDPASNECSRTNTPESEYSPTVTPDHGLSVVRVEADGTDSWRPHDQLRSTERAGREDDAVD
jgi:hypothetical protein